MYTYAINRVHSFVSKCYMMCAIRFSHANILTIHAIRSVDHIDNKHINMDYNLVTVQMKTNLL